MRFLWLVALILMIIWLIEAAFGVVGAGSFLYWLLAIPLLVAVVAFLTGKSTAQY